MTNMDEVIAVLDKLRKENPKTELIIETPGNTVTVEIGNALIYEDPAGRIVIDAE